MMKLTKKLEYRFALLTDTQASSVNVNNLDNVVWQNHLSTARSSRTSIGIVTD